MNTHLKTSIETATELLNDESQGRLATLVQSFAMTESAPVSSHFSEAELTALRQEADAPLDAADPDDVREFFARHGVTIKHDL